METEKRYCREVDSVSVDFSIAKNVEIEEPQRYGVYLHNFVSWIKSYPTYKFIHWISARLPYPSFEQPKLSSA